MLLVSVDNKNTWSPICTFSAISVILPMGDCTLVTHIPPLKCGQHCFIWPLQITGSQSQECVFFLVGMGSRAMDDAAESVGNHSKQISAAFFSVIYFSLLFSCFQPL